MRGTSRAKRQLGLLSGNALMEMKATKADVGGNNSVAAFGETIGGLLLGATGGRAILAFVSRSNKGNWAPKLSRFH